MTKNITRRVFMKSTAIAAGAVAGTRLLSGPFILAADALKTKLGVAVIGCGGMGGGNPGVAANERFVAMSDVDEKFIAKASDAIKAKVPDPKVYFDYRKMLDECQKEIDVVLIATPDHHHAPAAIRAIQMGKHVFVQKPLAHNIRESRMLAEAAKKNKVYTQMGNQGHCGEGYRRLVEYIQGGAIGNVLETHSIFSRNFGGKGGIRPAKPVPAGLHWDEWLGPAAFREYHDGLHPFSWRDWREFGTGTLGDMACHVMDGLFWALKLKDAKTYSIECMSQTPGSDWMFPQSNVLKFEFPARGEMPPVKVFTYDNEGQKPQLIKDLEKDNNRKFNDGTIYVGDKGVMYTGTYGDGVRILPEEKHQAFPAPAKSLPRAHGGPIDDLFWAIKNEGTPCSNFVDYSGPFTEMVLSGQLGMFAGMGKKVEWDVEKMQCTNLPEMNRFIRREYRKGWEV